MLDCADLSLLRVDQTGETPLIQAVKNGHSEVVRALLGKGMWIFKFAAHSSSLTRLLHRRGSERH